MTKKLVAVFEHSVTNSLGSARPGSDFGIERRPAASVPWASNLLGRWSLGQSHRAVGQ